MKDATAESTTVRTVREAYRVQETSRNWGERVGTIAIPSMRTPMVVSGERSEPVMD